MQVGVEELRPAPVAGGLRDPNIPLTNNTSHNGLISGQIIPRAWVQQMTTIVTPAEELYPEAYRSRDMGFGYMWWIWQDPDPEGPYVGAYTYAGSNGQYLTLLPKLDVVVAHQVFAGWFGPPDSDISWEEYQGILDRLVVARCPDNGHDCE